MTLGTLTMAFGTLTMTLGTLTMAFGTLTMTLGTLNYDVWNAKENYNVLLGLCKPSVLF